MINKTTRRVLAENFSGQWAAVMRAPFGHLGISTEMIDGSLMVSQLCYLPKTSKLLPSANDLAQEVMRQCELYFNDPTFKFDLPLAPAGTYFQNNVWNEIDKIRPGCTLTYGDIAKKIRSAPRAVGQACGSNPYPLIVPCHRVVSASGLGGFAHQDGEGFHRNVKTWLLTHENAL